MPARVLLDQNGCRVSKPGIDVLTNTNPAAFSFLSVNVGLGLFSTGLVSVPASGAAVNVNYPDFGYTPVISLMINEPGSSTDPAETQRWKTPYFSTVQRANFGLGGIIYRATNTQLSILSPANRACLVRYHIFYHG